MLYFRDPGGNHGDLRAVYPKRKAIASLLDSFRKRASEKMADSDLKRYYYLERKQQCWSNADFRLKAEGCLHKWKCQLHGTGIHRFWIRGVGDSHGDRH